MNRRDRTVFQIDPQNLADMGMDPRFSENLADGMGDIPGLQRTGCRTVQHGGEQEVVPAVDHRDPDIRMIPKVPGKVDRRVQPSETGSQNQNAIGTNRLRPPCGRIRNGR